MRQKDRLSHVVFGLTTVWILCLFGLPAQSASVHNIVLVHGAWVDASGWRPVYDILEKDGYHVAMVQEPLTSLSGDVAAARRIIDMQTGPVILVGHSYGGSVITEAGNDPKVVALVYICAHAPDAGETQSGNGKRFPSIASKLFAIKTTSDGFTYLDDAQFPMVFAKDVPLPQAQFEASSQVLTAATLFTTPISKPAWRVKPSWALIATGDEIISPELEKFYATRAHSHTVTIQGSSHSVYMTHPKEVVVLIEAAAKYTVTDVVP